LLNQPYYCLHPSEEHERVKNAFICSTQEKCLVTNIHLLTKDQRLIPIEISSSGKFGDTGQLLVIGIIHDISAQIEYEYKLASKNWALSAYSSAVIALGQSASSDTLMHAICDAIVQEPNYILAWIGIAEELDGKPVSVQAAAGLALGYLEGIDISWSADLPYGNGPTAKTIRTGQPVIMSDVEASPDFSFWLERAQKYNIKSSASVPLTIDNHRGALMVYANNANAFSADVIAVFQRLAQQIESGLHTLAQKQALDVEQAKVQQTESQIKQVLTATIGAMAATMESRDPYTSGHQSRVAHLAVTIGQELGWSENRIRGLEMASIVHDIGKIGIPIEILTKPSKLTLNERALISEHPSIGYNILKDIPFPWPIADIVHQHHEKMDGSGYPLQLQGDQILPEAQVLAVADIVESMASYRPYREALGIDVALAEIERQAGIQLDAHIVNTTLKLFRDKGFSLPKR
jgi:HD-GYP domain-containing protein (c-di-GMP phosphodiesterase class II)